MDAAKQQQLQQAYDETLQVSIADLHAPLEWIDRWVSSHVKGFGTAKDERVINFNDYKNLVLASREQGQGMEMALSTTPFQRLVTEDENTALYVDEMEVKMRVEGSEHRMYFRMSLVFLYGAEGWKLVHFHGSAPDNSSSSTDTFHVGQWKARAEELEKLVHEKTADLALKNRELEVETSLERVRSAANAMHESQDLLYVITVVGQQLEKLGLVFDSTNFRTNVGEKDWKLWIYAKWMGQPQYWYVPYIDSPFFAVDDQPGAVVTALFSVEEKNKFESYLASLGLIKEAEDPQVAALQKAFFDESKGFAMSIANQGVVSINMANSQAKPYSDEENNILLRFVHVFEQAYTRFLDLQKAEQQTREAQIEAALERVRARAMAMQNSEELKELISTVFIELTKLNFVLTRCTLMLFETGNGDCRWWMMHSEKASEPKDFLIPRHDHPPQLALMEAWKTQTQHWNYVLEGKVKKEWDDFLFTRTGLSQLPSFVIEGMRAPDKVLFSGSFNSFGGLVLASLEPLPEELFDILIRFTKVFELTYTRFNDLKQAEAQAREAQIQLSLERVRAKTMAMHQSKELLEVISVLSEQFTLLGFKIDSANFNTTYREKDWDLWLYNPGTPLYPEQIHIPYIDHPYFNRTIESIARGEELVSLVFDKKEKDSFLDHLYTNTIARHSSEERKAYCYNAPGFAWSAVYLKNTAVTIANYDAAPYTEEQNAILRKFGNAFEQSYTRFLDLKQAEAQKREAQIQLSLERVRARTMAMQRSEELAETSMLLFEEYNKLSIVRSEDGAPAPRASIGFFDEAAGVYDFWLTGSDGKKMADIYHVSLDEPVNISKAYHAWKEGKLSYVADIQGTQLDQWLDLLQEVGVPMSPALRGGRRVNHFAFFSRGNLGISTNEPVPEESLQLLQRFAETFNITYTRFLDLKDAEARAREAVKEASLDRVRAEIASMRTADDLQRITPLVWRELTALGVPFLRCGVFIVDDAKGRIQFYLSSPDGKPLAVLDQPFDESEVTRNVTEYWRKQETYTTHWSKEEFLRFAKDLVAQGQVTDVQQYQGGDNAPESLSLQFVPFKQGMMYVGSAGDLPADQIMLVQSLADAFSTAYARYEDFVQLEAAKEQIESTLKDLRATQTQLVQSEKMASLGELTAGIAHEIQNPLNFVNNFSELNRELIEELVQEIESGNYNEVKLIAKDIAENSEKINHHGKRADGIVKGMLQHSRTSSGQKELVDINALCDEYLRLAFHGLRAKDKSFNASFETDFDASAGKVNVQPQEIGRVVLNLINNAFYTVDERKKQEQNGYEPRVIIHTKRTNGRVNITISDNGTGIPQKLVDKIFQPFFTTKPTGKGTGLGLSLSYDIIKAHGGELSVTSTEGKGSSFTITLTETGNT